MWSMQERDEQWG